MMTNLLSPIKRGCWFLHKQERWQWGGRDSTQPSL